MAPLDVDGSYELTVRFMRTSGNDTVGIVLPVGTKTVLLGLGYGGNRSHGLDRVDGKGGGDAANPTVLRPARIENDREYVAHVKVIVHGDQAEVFVDLDDKAIINWRGSPSAFAMYKGWRLPQSNRVGLGVSNGSACFLSAQLRMLSGEAKPLRPGGVAQPEPPPKGPDGNPANFFGVPFDKLRDRPK